MFRINSRNTFFLAALAVVFWFFVSTPSASAQVAEYGLAGKAYWGSNGYVYFNCADAASHNYLDEVENLAGAGKFAVQAFHFYADGCADYYGVTIDENGRFDGQAWNATVGYINFYGDSAPSYFFNSNCPEANCTAATGCTACYNFVEQKAYGWAKVASSSAYINLNLVDNEGAGPSDILVRAKTNLGGEMIFPDAPGILLGDFAGRAVINGTTTPKMEFNCLTEDYPVGTCSTRDYKVYIKDLILGKMSAPNWNSTQACAASSLRAVLRWERMAGEQSAYEIVVSENNLLSTTTGQFACWSGKVTSTASQYIVSKTNPHCVSSSIKYNTNYYWWLRGFDADDNPTAWIKYNRNDSLSTDNDPDYNPETFTTFINEFPIPNFTWFPAGPATTSTSTLFTSTSQAFTPANPDTAQACGPTICPGYEWSTGDPYATILATTSNETDINFFTAGNTSVTLRVTDASNYQCALTQQLFINYGLPLWREVKAK